MEISWLQLALISALAAIFISKIIKIRRRPEPKLPPGPKPWPIIGNLNLLGSIPHQTLHHLSQKYGDIMLLKFGKFPVVVASSPKMAEQFLKVHDAVFASRPSLAAGKHISYDYSDVSFAPYGPYWREARKIYMSELLSNKNLEKFEHIRVEERQYLLSRLRSQSGKALVLKDQLSQHYLSTICRMLLRDNISYLQDKQKGKSSLVDELREMVDEWLQLSGAFVVGDWIPWLAFLDLQGYVKRMKLLRDKMDRFFDFVIDDHLATRRNIGKDCVKQDFVDVLLQIAEDPHAEVEITRDGVKALTMNLILGGINTTATTIVWAIHEILRQPRIIEKAKDELATVIGRQRWVQENDLVRLPYINAIIMETFRLHAVATMLAPHSAINDCNVAGYDIPKGTMVFVNTWSIGRDPHSWDAPEEFLPERFMERDDIDMSGSNFALLPFGSGRRMCPAYNLGLKLVRATLANLLHGFELKLVDGMRPEDISLEEKYGLSTHPKHSLSIIFNPTLPDHLY